MGKIVGLQIKKTPKVEIEEIKVQPKKEEKEAQFKSTGFNMSSTLLPGVIPKKPKEEPLSVLLMLKPTAWLSSVELKFLFSHYLSSP